MSKKNSSASLKIKFKEHKELSKIYLKFKGQIKNIYSERIAIAISGGPDSLALAALAKNYSLEKKKRFYYILVDHRIRKNSSKEALKVKKILKKFEIKLNILTNYLKIKKNVQSNARTIRYKLLSKFCEKKKITTILTAHNLEDQVETFFIRLSRGSGLSGLSAMQSSVKIQRYLRLHRPLLEIKKRDLTKISKIVFGEYISDPSNRNTKYLRVKIRKLKKPLMNSGISYDQIIKSINNLASSKATLEKFMIKKSKELIKKKVNGRIFIDLKKFNRLNEEIQIRVINDVIKKLQNNYYNPRSKKVVNLIKNIKDKAFKKRTLSKCIFERQKDQLSIKKEKK
tara:strand:+ start:179 stop:1201 length:1023 start_codon:yes stop_codon:yes gene_type:complete